MAPEKRVLVGAWVEKARSDLATARLLISGDELHLDTGVYHCQQAAEKILKAFLTEADIIFPKTHNLSELLQLAVAARPELGELGEHAMILTPYGTEFRYPGDLFEPPLAECLVALGYAAEVLSLVESLLGSSGEAGAE